LDGGHAISVQKEEEEEEDDEDVDMTTHSLEDDDDDGCIDASRIEQLLGRRQLYAVGVCVAWILQEAPKHPQLGLKDLLQRLDNELDAHGMYKILNHVGRGSTCEKTRKTILESIGYLERPRSYEVGQALLRMHGIEMEELPTIDDDGADDAARLEEERRKKALADLWASRRAKSTS
jgi:hypothetical protein